MKKLSKFKLFKVFSVLLTSIVGYYFFEFYLTENNANLHFWCIQINKNFNFGFVNGVSLPIHCDEGPYRLASQSIDQFFSKNNPYQTRPLYVFFIYFISNLIDYILFFDLSEYQNFRFTMIILQILIMSCIVLVFSSIMKLEYKSYKDYLIIILLIGIPGVRWNVFFPSVGNLTLLFFLITLKLITDKPLTEKNKYFMYLFLSFLSLAHLSSIIYGLIYEFIDFVRTKKINFFPRLLNIGLLILIPLIYRFIVYVSNYEFYDWHTGVHGQYSWIIYEIQNGTFFNFKTLTTHIITYLSITLNYLGYFLIILGYFLCLVFLTKYKKKDIPINVKYALAINIIIFSFWGLQGIYESFRFTNYSIGYFLFVSTFILLVEMFKKNVYLIASLFFYHLSIGYIEPYNAELDYPQVNILTYLSLGLFIVFIIKEIRLDKKVLINDS